MFRPAVGLLAAACLAASVAPRAARAQDPAAESSTARVDAGRDFTPGTRVLLATDFSRDEIGDFPRGFRLRSGNAEVADVGGRRWLRATSIGELDIPLPETLPPMFTIEFDFSGGSGWYQAVHLTDRDDAYRVEFRPDDGGIVSAEEERSMSDARGTQEGKPLRVQIMADGDYVKVYLNGTRVANMPNARLGRSRIVRIKFRGEDDMPTLLGNIRIAAGGKDLYKALEADGRVTAEGILFDTNSDRLRPESDAVLGQIGAMLTKHADLRLGIEGHTDNVGAAAANTTLSEKRAAAVKAYLVSKHGVDAARLEAKGFGASKPVAPNTDEAGRQKNRRVELVKL
jgi:outer membrane protein OmpA-like peptidoglycan-associated protein